MQHGLAELAVPRPGRAPAPAPPLTLHGARDGAGPGGGRALPPSSANLRAGLRPYVNEPRDDWAARAGAVLGRAALDGAGGGGRAAGMGRAGAGRPVQLAGGAGRPP